MEEKLTPVQWIAVVAVWGLICYGLWQLGGWLFVELMSLTPKKLAMGCIAITVVPLILLIIFGIAGLQNAMTVAGAVTILSFWLAIPGLLISGFWYLFLS